MITLNNYRESRNHMTAKPSKQTQLTKRRKPEESEWGESIRRRFWKKVNITSPEDDLCWEWGAAFSKCGYGVFKIHGRTQYAHRAAFQLAFGPIAEGKYVLHKCDNRKCCRPKHLFEGSAQQNLRDASQKKRLWQNRRHFCPQGHPYSVNNTYVRPNGWRECRTCRRDHKRDHRRRQPSPALAPAA